MIIEILIILLIIIALLIFLLFFKSWNIHVLFENDNFIYVLSLVINFLFIRINIEKTNSNSTVYVILNIFSHKKQIFSQTLNSDGKNKQDSKENSDENNKFSKLKELTLLLLDSKEDLYNIIILLTGIITFKQSRAELNIGLGNNNLTIKLCNLIWALSAPFYPLNFEMITIPKINETILKSNADVTLNMRLFNLLKILFVIIKNKNFRNIIKLLE